MNRSLPSDQSKFLPLALPLEFIRIDRGTLVATSGDCDSGEEGLTVQSAHGVVEIVGSASLGHADEWDSAVVAVRSTGAAEQANITLTVSLFNFLTDEFDPIGGAFASDAEPYTISLPARLGRRSPHVDDHGAVRIRLGYQSGVPRLDEYCCVIHSAQISSSIDTLEQPDG